MKDVEAVYFDTSVLLAAALGSSVARAAVGQAIESDTLILATQLLRHESTADARRIESDEAAAGRDRRRFKKGREYFETFQASVDYWLPISDDVMRIARRLVHKHRLTLPDAVHAAHCIRERAEFVTMDADFVDTPGLRMRRLRFSGASG